MIKVLNVLTDTNIGGAGRLLVHYLRNFDRSRFEVYVALPEGSLLIPEVEKVGYSVITTKHGKDKTFEAGAVKELCGIIRELKPHIVHSHASLSARVASLLCGIKSRMYTRHCAYDLPESAKRFPKKLITGAVNNTLSTAIVAVADAAADNLTDTGVDPRKITVIQNGVEKLPELSDSEKTALRKSLGIKESETVLIINARLTAVKGHDYLLRAFKGILEAKENVKLIVLGTGEEEARLKALAKELDISDKVIFTGFVSDVAPYINISNINVNFSWGTETSSLAISEAMTLGVPTVASDFGGNPGMIEEGINGILVPNKDEIALRDALIGLINDPERLKKLGAGARELYEKRFTSAVMTRKLEALYEKEYKDKYERT